MIIDGRTLVTGSFNFTRQAEIENAENLLILKGYIRPRHRLPQGFRQPQVHARQPEIKRVRPAHQEVNNSVCSGSAAVTSRASDSVEIPCFSDRRPVDKLGG